MNQPPKLSLEQRRAALAKAAQARKVRSVFKSEIKDGSRNWQEAFEHPDAAIQKMRVKELLTSLPGFGEIRASLVMERAGISTTRRVQGVGKTQLDNLFRILKEER